MLYSNNSKLLEDSANGTFGDPASVLFDMEQTEAYEEVLINCCREGDAERAKAVLQRCLSLDINTRDRRNGNTALIWAASRGHAKVVEVLLTHGADQTLVNSQKQTALELSSPSVQKVLLSYGSNGRKISNRRLLQAAWMCDFGEVHRLLDGKDKGLHANCKNDDGLTPLLLLARDMSYLERVSESLTSFRPADVADELLRGGAECRAVESQSGLTALHMACSGTSKQSIKLVQTLLRHGADTKARDRFGFTPLHCAAKAGNVGAISALINHAGNDMKVDVKGLAGSTPLHLSAMGGHEDAVRTLLKAGADANSVDESGQTPIEMGKTRRIKYILQGKTPPIETTQPDLNSQKKVLGPVRTPSRLLRAKSFGGLKDLALPVATLGLAEPADRSNNVARSPSDGSLELWQHPFFLNAGSRCATPGKGNRGIGTNQLSVTELSASAPFAPSRPDSGASHLGARNSYFRRSTPVRSNRNAVPVHLPPVVTSKSPAPSFFLNRSDQPDLNRSESGEHLIICGRGSTRTFVEDLEENITMPSAMVPASPVVGSIPHEEFAIPDTITEADIESARSVDTARSLNKSSDCLPGPVIQVPRRQLKPLQSERRRSVKFLDEDENCNPVDIRSSLELGSPRHGGQRRHERKSSCPEVEVDDTIQVVAEGQQSDRSVKPGDERQVQTEESSAEVNTSAREISHAAAASQAGPDLRSISTLREPTTVRSQGPQPSVAQKKNTIAKFKGPLIAPKPQRAAIKMSPVKGRSIPLTDKQQKVDRLKKVASQPVPDAQGAVASSSSVALKPVRPRRGSKERVPADVGDKPSSKPQPQQQQQQPSSTSNAKDTVAKSNSKDNQAAAGTEASSGKAPVGAGAAQDAGKQEASDAPGPSRTKTPTPRAPSAKTNPNKKPAIAKGRATDSSSKVGARDGARASVQQNKVMVPVTSVKAANKRKMSAPSGKRRVNAGKKKTSPVESQSSSPPLPAPEDGTALISGIGWHVHTTANPEFAPPTPPYGSPRSAIFATKYPVIGKIGTSDDFEPPSDKEDAPYQRNPIDIATPSIPFIDPSSEVQLEQGFGDDDPTPRNQYLDDRQLTEISLDRGQEVMPPNQEEASLSPPPLKELDELAEIEGPMFDDDDDDELPFRASDSDGEGEGGETFIDLEADDDLSSNADWHRRVEATDYLDLLRKCSRNDFVRGDRTAPTPASASKGRYPSDILTEGQFEQSWQRDSLRSGVSVPASATVTPGDTMKSNISQISSVDTLGGKSQLGETIDWKRGNLLGRGAFGRVFCGMTARGELIAVKQIELSNDDRSKEEVQKIEEEIELLKTCRHRNIVQFYGTSRTESLVNIFMEYLPGGSIQSLLNRFGVFEERVFCRYTRQILDGVAFLHSMNIVHRDIKGGNLMLMPNGRIKLIDFGCAKRLAQQTSQQQLQNSMQGSPYWMAPEVIHETGHGPKSDCWSIGCTVFEMATTKPPWAHLQPYAAIFAIGSGEGPVPALDPKSFTPAACSFVARCLTRDPKQRPSAQELLEDQFVLKRSRSRKNTISSEDQSV